MMILDQTQLLQAITQDSPCGPDLEYDPAFLEFERSARVEADDRVVGATPAGEGPDWRAVSEQARKLLERTKDLRVVMVSVKAALRLGGIPAFGAAVASLRGLIELYWEPIHPRLEFDGDDNTLLRINILRELCDRDGVLAPLRAAPLVSLPALGSFSLRDIAIARGEQPPIPPAQTQTAQAQSAQAQSAQPAPPVVDMTSIDTAFANCGQPQLQQTAAVLLRLRDDVTGIENFVNARVRTEHALSLEPLADVVARLNSEFKTRAGDRLLPARPTSAALAGPAPSASTPPNAQQDDDMRGASPSLGVDAIASRADVARALDRLCQYYDRNEPSSPVPILLRRAKRMVSMSFVDLVRELAPAGITELETIRGPQEAENR